MKQSGIVCCFDILGYQKIIDTNQIEYVASLISDKICLLPNEAQKQLTGMIQKLNQDKEISVELADISERIKYISISDTIIASCPINPEKDNILGVWYVFIVQMGLLARLAFDAGLPMRGAIDTGEFYVKGNTFAGKPIINSYRLAEQLDFSGCVLTPAAGNFLMSMYSVLPAEQGFKQGSYILMPYLVPLKNNEYDRLLVLNWMVPENNLLSKPCPDDFRQYVNTAFHEHNKEVDHTVAKKIDNTERMIRWMKERKWELNIDSLRKVPG